MANPYLRLTKEESEAARKRGYQKAFLTQLKNQQAAAGKFANYANDYVANWQSQDDLDRYFDDMSGMKSYLQTYRNYVNLYGTDEQKKSLPDLDSALEKYGSVLGARDDIKAEYGQYNSAESWQKAINAAKDYEAEQARLLGLDVDALREESDKLAVEESLYTGGPITGPLAEAYKKKREEIKEKKYAIDADIEAAERARRNQMYRELPDAEGFDSLSAFDGAVNDSTYDAIAIAKGASPDIWKYMLDGQSVDLAEVKDYYSHLTDNEVALYRYLYATHGEDAANRFLSDMDDVLKQRQAGVWADNVKGNALLEILASVPIGVDQFASGIRGLFGDTSTSAMQYLSGYIREDMEDNAIGRTIYDLGTTTGNMLPSILVSFIPVVGKPLGIGLMGASAGGNAYAEMKNLGYNDDQAIAYATMVGASEALLSTLFSGISSLGGKVTGHAIEKAVSQVDNAIAKVAIQVGGSALSEGLEEATQEALDPIFRAIATGDDVEGIDWGEVAYAALLGALSAGMMEGPGVIAGTYGTYTKGKNLQAAGRAQELTNLASSYPKTTDTAKLRGRAESKGGNFRLGNLLETMNRESLGKTQSEIMESLQKQGLSEKKARRAAKEILAGRGSLLSLNVGAVTNQKKLAAARKKALENVPEAMKKAQSEAKTLIVQKDGADVTTSKRPEILTMEGDSISEVFLDVEGKKTAADSLSFADGDLALLYDYAPTLGSVKAANAFIQNWDGNTDPERYWSEWMLFQSRGEIAPGGYEQLAAERKNRILSEVQRLAAFKSGVELSQEVRKARQEKIDAVVTEYRKSGKKLAEGKLDSADVRREWDSLTEEQKGYYHFLQMLPKAMGVNVRVVVSKKGSRGDNGSYNRNTNTLTIDLNAGIKNDANFEAVKSSFLYTLSHESVHWMAVNAPKEYGVLRDAVMGYLAENGDVETRVKARWDKMKEYDPKATKEDAIEEIVARSCEDFFAGSEKIRGIFEEMAKKDKSVLEKFKEALGKILHRIRTLFDKFAATKSYSDDAITIQNMGEKVTTELRTLYEDAFAVAIEGSMARTTETHESAGGVMHSLRNEFVNEYDRWDKKDPRVIFYLGQTSAVLQSLGIAEKNITWDSSKIIKIKAKHSEMTDTIIKQVPHILEDPILVMRSKSDTDRMTLFGEVYAAGKPVLAVLELSPMGRKGIVLDELKIASAYGKDNAQRLIDTSEILYVEGNKKRASAWEKRTGLQLPVGFSNNGSGHSILQNSQNVNSISLKNSAATVTETKKAPEGERAIMYQERESLAEAAEKMEKISDTQYLHDKSIYPFIQVMDYTPKKVLDSIEGGKDRRILIRRDALYLAVRGNGIQEGHYHGLGANVLKQLPKYLESPDLILSTIDPNTGKESQTRRIVLSQIDGANGQGLVSVEFDSLKDFEGEREYFNIAITVFDLHKNYLERLFKKNGAIIKAQKESLSQENPQLYEWLRSINEKLSNKSIPHSKEVVKPENKNSETEEMHQRREETPEPSEVLRKLFSDNASYADYAAYAESLKSYQELLERAERNEKRMEKIDAEIETLKSQRKQSGKGTEMYNLFKQKELYEGRAAEARRRMTEMEAGKLKKVVDSEIRRAVEAGMARTATVTETKKAPEGEMRQVREETVDITSADVEILRSIGRKSINEFTSEEIQKAEPWARKFFGELGTKSPFFRAWFGDWRAYDKTEIRVIEIDQSSVISSGNAVNKDMGRKMSWGKDIAKESVLNAPKKYKDDMAMIASNVSKIVENAIAFDTVISEKSSDRKLDGTAWMHSLYCVVELNGKTSLVKLFAEEAFSQKQDTTFTRAYSLKHIEKIAEFDNGVLSLSGGLTDSHSTTVYSISDLFELVKRYDKNFSPKPVEKVLLNENGTPKIFYHGTDGSFTVFSRDEMAEREGSFFFAENREDAAAYGRNVLAVYLTGKKLADYDNQASEFYHLRNKRAQVEYLKERGYDGWYADMDSGGWGELSVFSPIQIKSATDNIGTFDGENPDIMHQRREEPNPIREGMTDEERYDALKNRFVTLSAYADYDKLSMVQKNFSVAEEEIEFSKYGDRVRLFKKLGEEFSVFRRYDNPDIKLNFSFSKENMRESVSKQRQHYMRLVKMLTCLDRVVENAIGMEVHNRNAEGYKADDTLNNVYVLASAFVDGENIVPVKLEVKEFSDKENTLHVAIALESINKDGIVKQEVATNGVARQYSPPSAISIADIFRNVNTADKNFLKYIPDPFLNEAQKAAKKEALEEERRKIERLKQARADADVMRQVREERSANQSNSGDKQYLSMEDFTNQDSSVWRNVEYDDESIKESIMRKTHMDMVREDAVVRVPDKIMQNVEQSFPDLRGMKKKDRTPILKESMNKLKDHIRRFLNGLKNQGFEFEINGRILEAKLYNTGINEVIEKVTQEKANMLYASEKIFRNARYLYSTPDYGGDPNVYRWNYFYTPVQVGEEIVGVRIAVKDIAQGQDHMPESQIYNWGIKKGTFLDGVQPVVSDSSHDVSSNVPNGIVPQPKEIVKPENEISETEEMHQRREETPEPSEVLRKLFSDNAAYADYAAYTESLKSYQELLERAERNEKRVEKIDAEIEALKSQRKQSGKGTEMYNLFKQKELYEGRAAEARRRMTEMEAGKLKKVVDAEVRRAVEQRAREEREIARERSKERTDAISKRVYIERIQKRVGELEKKIRKNSAKEHIPDVFKAPILELLTAIDFSSESKLSRGKETKKDQRFASSLDELARLFAEWKEKPEDLAMQGLDLPGKLFQDFIELNERVRAIAEGKGKSYPDRMILREMSVEDLAALNRGLGIISHAVSDAGKLIANARFQKIGEAATSSMGSFQKYRQHRQGKSLVKDFLEYQNILPAYFFERLGDAAKSMYDSMLDGQEKLSFLVREIVDFAEHTYTAEQAKEWAQDVRRVTLNGTEVYMTVPQLMYLRCLAKRDQGRKHLFGGGASVETIDEKILKVAAQKAGAEEIQNAVEGFRLRDEDLLVIERELSDEQIRVADALQDYMVERGGNLGNEISMIRFGTRLFNEAHYMPIYVDPNARTQKDADHGKPAKAQNKSDLYRLINISATHSLQEQANARVLIRDIFDVFSEHMSDMALYNSFCLPLLDMLKWYNYTELDADGNKTILKDGLRHAFGEGAQRYMVNFMSDINNAQSLGRGEEFSKKMASNYKIAAVAANLRVALLQPTSYIRAAAVLNAGDMGKAVLSVGKIRRGIRKAQKYSGMALWKSLGYYDLNISSSVTAKIKHTDTLRDKVVDASLKPAEWGDKITWGVLWNACEWDVSRRHPNLTYDSEAYNQAVSKRFREVIVKTQVMDSVLTRSDIMRSKSGITQAGTSFMSEPTVTYNILWSIKQEYDDTKRRGETYGRRRLAKKVGRVAGVFVASVLCQSLMESLVDAMRNDDEEKDFGEKYVSELWENLLSELNLLDSVPFVKEFDGVVKETINLVFGTDISTYGGSSSRMDTAYIEAIEKAIRKLAKFAEEPIESMYAILDALSKMTGLPASNLIRDFAALWNTMIGEINPNLVIILS